MQVQVHADHAIRGAAFTSQIEGIVESALNHHAERITRVDVHLADENGKRQVHEDKRCSVEARIGGHQPLAVTCHGESLEAAVGGALDKISRLIDNTVERLRDTADRRTDPPPPHAL